MVEFTHAILASLIFSGYKWLKVENNEDYVIIEPLMNEVTEMTENAYTIPISDEQASEMAGKILLLDIKFYIDSKFIE